MPRRPTYDVTDVGNTPGDGPLRVDGRSVSDIPETKENLPSTLSPSAESQVESLTIMRHTVAGTPTIREEASTYLPKGAGEGPQSYRERLQRAVFFNVVGRTVEGLVGQVFKKDIRLGDDVPAVIKDQQWENIDLAGTHGDVFARDILQDGITAGHCAILVEFPQTGGTQNHGQERTEIRPYWVPIRKENILSWRTTVENGKTVLTQLVLKECQSVPAGAFGEKEQTRYRVFTRDASGVSFRLLEITDNKSLVTVDEGTYPTQDEIPVAEIVTSGRTALFESVPPLLDLAYLNIAHYQMWADYATSINKTCVPIFYAFGLDELSNPDGTKADLVLGPNSAVTSSNPTAKCGYASHDGASLDKVEKALEGLKSDMGTMGIAMLAPQKRSAETLGAKKLDKSTEDSALSVTARGLEDGLERALGFHAKYLRLPTGGSVIVNKEFDEKRMEADMLQAWTGAVGNAGVPPKYMLEDMQLGGLIPPDEDVEIIADEMAANKAAADDAKAQHERDLLAMKTQQPVVKPDQVPA